MLLFQYLVNALEGDFVPRNRVYGETMNWTCLRESWHLLSTTTSLVTGTFLFYNCTSTHLTTTVTDQHCSALPTSFTHTNLKHQQNHLALIPTAEANLKEI
ncbi:hypothetical protein NC651_010407 [Populus alba x Populus x berolinensis]|nr:hypothetical protein NC651_010407 [Populus alba x Populus x berolinensis]